MLTFGSDPEFVLVDQQGRCKSAVGIVPGDRDDRHKIPPHEFFYDNVLAECAIHPGETKREVVKNFRDCFRKYAKLVKPYRLAVRAAHTFPPSELQSPAAYDAGCDPETCAYTFNDFKKDREFFLTTRLRTAGGHIHLGHPILKKAKGKPMNAYNRMFVARMLDLFLGIPSIYMNVDKTEKRRKSLYGQAGRYRDRDHGVEYRTLSNFWLASPHLVNLVYDICKYTFQFVSEERHWDFWSVDFDAIRDDSNWEREDFNTADYHKCFGYDVESLRKAIDNLDRRRADRFLKFIGELVPSKLYQSILSACEYPAEYDFYEEWKLQ